MHIARMKSSTALGCKEMAFTITERNLSELPFPALLTYILVLPQVVT